jgi:hypothetical protein
MEHKLTELEAAGMDDIIMKEIPDWQEGRGRELTDDLVRHGVLNVVQAFRLRKAIEDQAREGHEEQEDR